ncbi:MAG: hypothetical protein JWN34_3506 [Bryobacterales bacterium]|nr:hypothetical protein [Bryobacterales bacterium]
MSDQCSGNNGAVSPYALAKALDDCAKLWWGVSLAAKGLGFLTGAFISFLKPEPVPFIVAGFALIAESCTYRSDALKSAAQQFRRKLDMQDGFGWPIPKTDLSDIWVRSSFWIKRRARSLPADEPYFASTDPPGPVRALRNVSESAWWTKHLSHTMAICCWTTLVIGTIVSIIILILALQATQNHSDQVNVARQVTAFLMFFLSFGIVKLALSYTSLNKNGESSEKAADRALQTTTPEVLSAFKLMYDYHLSRAAGPLFPNWLWRLRERDLNQTWKEHRNGQRTQ